MSKGIITETGRLRDRFLPAIYFDSSVLIDYWMTEGWNTVLSQGIYLGKNGIEQYYDAVRKLLHSNERLGKVAELRSKLELGENKTSVVISPLCILELIEWYAEAVFKQIAAEASSAKHIQRISKKEVGEYIRKALKLQFRRLVEDTLLNRSFANAHGLHGLIQVDISNFHLSISNTWQEPSYYAYLQVGTGDIMHILIAQHLGCDYIASFDDDFKRIKDVIYEETGMNLLSSPEEILKVL